MGNQTEIDARERSELNGLYHSRSVSQYFAATQGLQFKEEDFKRALGLSQPRTCERSFRWGPERPSPRVSGAGAAVDSL